MLSKLRTDKSGFTLIELMIVVAIIGILMAIAIPNYINYRNKSICSSVESDANSYAAAVSDYFSDMDHTALPSETDLNGVEHGKYTASINITGDPNTGIVVEATPNTAGYKCPKAGANLKYSLTIGGHFGTWK